jgi:hypothetical protein
LAWRVEFPSGFLLARPFRDAFNLSGNAKNGLMCKAVGMIASRRALRHPDNIENTLHRKRDIVFAFHDVKRASRVVDGF